jgi:exopolyphosphatase/guanosine-5'-triphosphate,3'-diphosphate pyrophosphatase
MLRTAHPRFASPPPRAYPAGNAMRGAACRDPRESEQDMTRATDSAEPLSTPGPVTNRAEPSLRNAAETVPGAVERAAASAEAPGPPDWNGGEGRRTGNGVGRRRGNGRREHGPFYAALDLGTNNCRLLIAEPSGDSFRVVDSFSRIVRLGEGVARERKLRPEAMERALGALRICSRKLGYRPMAGARLIATQACRIAENGRDFMDRVREETGIALEVVNQRTEAQLAAEGCFTLLDREADGALLFDIGGGSSEIVWIDRRRRRRGGLIRAWVSLPVGVVTLAERHGGTEVSSAVFEAMVDDVRSEFYRFHARSALGEAVRSRAFHYLGTSGTVTTLAGVHLDLPRYNRRMVDGLWMEEADIELMMTRIRGMDYEARRRNPCIGRERADLVLAGCAIFEAIRGEWPCGRLRVADRGLREGMLVQLMRADGYLRGRGQHNGPAGALPQ